MIKIYSSDQSEYYGNFRHFKDAIPMLNNLIHTGKLPGKVPGVTVYCYKNDQLKRTYIATFCGKWHVPKETRMSQKCEYSPAKVILTRRERLRKRKDESKKYFQAGLPDWITKPMPVFM